jgi:hypothetical protein
MRNLEILNQLDRALCYLNANDKAYSVIIKLRNQIIDDCAEQNRKWQEVVKDTEASLGAILAGKVPYHDG